VDRIVTLPAEATGSAPGRGVACADRDEGVKGGIAGRRMSNQIVSNVSYPVTPGTTVLLSIDCQFGFGAGSWEQVPHADAAVGNFRKASRAWRWSISCAPGTSTPWWSGA
jgi:hypothetical protein